MNIHQGGDAYCWSCETRFSKKEVEEGSMNTSPKNLRVRSEGLSLQEISDLPSAGLAGRKISKQVMEHFGVKVETNKDTGLIVRHYYPQGSGYKCRYVKDKKFFDVGDAKGIFGLEAFTPGGKRLVITTGEIDAMSYAEACLHRYKRMYPVISFGSDKHVERLLDVRDFVRSFDEVVLMFDQDSSGQKSLEKAIPIVGMDKVKIARLTRKDPNDVLKEDGPEALMTAIFDAQPYIPGGILGRDELWDLLEDYNSIQSMPFPPCLSGVNLKTKGKRYGDITLFISGTGSGKSTLLREDALFTLETTDDKIGWLAFEEGPGESARKLSGMALKRNPANEEIPLEELREGFNKVFGDDRIMVLDHQGSMNDESIVDKLEYMCLSGCKHIYIDHITILVSEGVEGLTGNEAQDKIMNDLLRLVKRYPVWIGLVSHLRKVKQSEKSFEEGQLPSMDDIRGSGSVKQVSMDIIAFARNMAAKSSKVRNKVKMSVLKCRFTGLTGPVNGALYDFETGRLNPLDYIVPDDEEDEEMIIEEEQE